MHIILSKDDTRLGIAGKGGKRPETDVLGDGYTWPPMSRAELGNGFYAVLPMFPAEQITVALEAETPAGAPISEEVPTEAGQPPASRKRGGS